MPTTFRDFVAAYDRALRFTKRWSFINMTLGAILVFTFDSGCIRQQQDSRAKLLLLVSFWGLILWNAAARRLMRIRCPKCACHLGTLNARVVLETNRCPECKKRAFESAGWEANVVSVPRAHCPEIGPAIIEAQLVTDGVPDSANPYAPPNLPSTQASLGCNPLLALYAWLRSFPDSVRTLLASSDSIQKRVNQGRTPSEFLSEAWLLAYVKSQRRRAAVWLVVAMLLPIAVTTLLRISASNGLPSSNVVTILCTIILSWVLGAFGFYWLANSSPLSLQNWLAGSLPVLRPEEKRTDEFYGLRLFFTGEQRTEACRPFFELIYRADRQITIPVGLLNAHDAVELQIPVELLTGGWHRLVVNFAVILECRDSEFSGHEIRLHVPREMQFEVRRESLRLFVPQLI